ncbi:hypothetical protein [Kitasatospora sp. NPDC005748]|uniref:hypothetical protein n=1 Tax=Kitasatospora sp. NPDC005748 TaxID=3157063 RepID=UPI0033EC5BE0
MRIRAVVTSVDSLPEGRRVAKFEGPGVVGLAFLKSEISAELAEELQEIMQAALDAGLWNQNWEWAVAMMLATTRPTPAPAS